MRQIKNSDDIKSLGTILSVWAHPDDESFTSAGILAAAVQNSQQVICVTATKGEQGVQDETRWPQARLSEIRTEELSEALKILGITKHHWLGYADGGCKQAPNDEAVAKIAEFIRKYQPDTILTFGPDGLTGHDDHRTVSEWASHARELAGSAATIFHVVETTENYENMKQADEKFNIYFNTDKPPLVDAADCDILLHLEGDLLEKKYQALSAQVSQMEAMFKHFGKDRILEMISTEAFVRARGI